MVKVIKPFCWDQNFDPNALPAPAPWLYTREKKKKKKKKKTLKKCV